MLNQGLPPQEEVTAATTAAAATVSQELSPFGQAPGPSRPGTKYPVRGIPHFDKDKQGSVAMSPTPEREESECFPPS